MLRVAEHHAFTDTGQQRRHNEDAYYARTPVFAVADGMGGAQAGEVASHAAVEAVAAGLPEDGHARGSPRRRRPRARTRRSSACRARTTRAPAWARRSPPSTSARATSRSPTSATPAPTASATASSSRLTEDHSLVEEMRRRGQLTAEEADEHPQRSIITRALGPEPDVARRHPLVGRARRRRHPALQRRADVDDLRGPGRRDPARGRPGWSRPAARSSPPPTAPAGATTSPSSCCASRTSAAAPRRRATHDQPTEVHDAPTQDGGRADRRRGPPGGRRRPRPPRRRRRRLPRRARKDARPGGARAARRRALVVLAVVADRARPGRDRRATSPRRPSTSSAPRRTGSSPCTAGCPTTCPPASTSTAPTTSPASRSNEVPAARRATLLDHQLRSHDDAADLVRELEQGRLTAR